jgi:hypothetical protein
MNNGISSALEQIMTGINARYSAKTDLDSEKILSGSTEGRAICEKTNEGPVPNETVSLSPDSEKEARNKAQSRHGMGREPLENLGSDRTQTGFQPGGEYRNDRRALERARRSDSENQSSSAQNLSVISSVSPVRPNSRGAERDGGLPQKKKLIPSGIVRHIQQTEELKRQRDK